MTTNTIDKIISINDMRKRFGEIEKELPFVDYFIVTKKGKPFAKLSATSNAKREAMKKTAGKLKNTELDSDTLWLEVAKRKSRKDLIIL